MNVNDLPLHYKLVYIALLSCFKSKEVSICTTRLRARLFSSHPLLDIQLLKCLEKYGAIETKPLSTSSKKVETEREVFIAGDNSDKPSTHAQRLLSDARDQLKDDKSYFKLTDLLLCLLAGECIEYANFYAERNGISIVTDVPSFKQTKTMLNHLSVGQMNMLFWRATQNIPNNDDDRTCQLEELLELVKSYYIKYTQQGIKIQNYDRLRSAQPSKLSFLLFHDILKCPERDHLLVGPSSYFDTI